MRSRNVVYSLVLVLAVLAGAIVKFRQEPQRKEQFNRDNTRLEYAAFALCRMQCNRIDKKAVEEIMQKGIIHFNKSERRRWPCPSFTVQGRTYSGVYLRVIFEQCKSKTTVLNCYLLEGSAECNCPSERN